MKTPKLDLDALQLKIVDVAADRMKTVRAENPHMRSVSAMARTLSDKLFANPNNGQSVNVNGAPFADKKDAIRKALLRDLSALGKAKNLIPRCVEAVGKSGAELLFFYDQKKEKLPKEKK